MNEGEEEIGWEKFISVIEGVKEKKAAGDGIQKYGSMGEEV